MTVGLRAGVAGQILHLHIVGVVRAARQAGVLVAPGQAVHFHVRAGQQFAVAPHRQDLARTECRAQGAVQGRGVVVGVRPVLNVAGHRILVVDDMGQHHRLGRRYGVDVDFIAVGGRPRVLRRVLDVGGVDMLPVRQIRALAVGPRGAGHHGFADRHAVAHHNQHLTGAERRTQGAADIRTGVVGPAPGFDVAGHRQHIIVHPGDLHGLGRPLEFDINVVVGGIRPGVARFILNPRGVDVVAVVGQPAVRVGPGGAGHHRLADGNAVTVDGQHLVVRQRFAELTAQFRRGVIGGLARLHIADPRRLVVIHRRDGDHGVRGGGVDVDGVAAGDRAAVPRQVAHQRGVGVGAAVRQAAVIKGPRGAGHGGASDLDAVTQHHNKLGVARGRTQGAAHLRGGVVGPAVVVNVAELRRHVIPHSGDFHTLGRGGGIHMDGVAVGFVTRITGRITDNRGINISITVSQAAVGKGPVIPCGHSKTNFSITAENNDFFTGSQVFTQCTVKGRGIIVGVTTIFDGFHQRQFVILDIGDNHSLRREPGIHNNAEFIRQVAFVTGFVDHFGGIDIGRIIGQIVSECPLCAMHRGCTDRFAVAVNHNTLGGIQFRIQRTDNGWCFVIRHFTGQNVFLNNTFVINDISNSDRL